MSLNKRGETYDKVKNFCFMNLSVAVVVLKICFCCGSRQVPNPKRCMSWKLPLAAQENYCITFRKVERACLGDLERCKNATSLHKMLMQLTRSESQNFFFSPVNAKTVETRKELLLQFSHCNSVLAAQ